MKRILAIILMLAVIVCSFASCTRLSAAEALQNAYPQDGQSYTCKSEVTFNCGNEAVIAKYPILDEKTTFRLTVSGDDMKIITMTPANGGIHQTEQTFIGNTVYISSGTVGHGVSGQKLRVDLTNQQREELFEDSNDSADLYIGDFETVKTERAGDSVFYYLTDFKETEAEVLEEFVLNLIGEEGSAEILSLSITIELVDGFVRCETVDCEYRVYVGRSRFTIPMSVVSTYSYEPQKINTPSDKEYYRLIPYDSVFE